MVVIIGIDLAGSPKRESGICIITGGRVIVQIARSDEEILALVSSVPGRKAIGMDAPLSLPPGRKNIDEAGKQHFRACDRALRKLGIPFFPITLGPMRMLTKRGMSLKREFRRAGARVFEVYPGATYDIFKIGRKDGRSILSWASGFLNLEKRKYSQDELDAICAAITILLHLSGRSQAVGNRREGQIILPASGKMRAGKRKSGIVKT